MKKFQFSLQKLKGFKEQIKKREENILAALRAEKAVRVEEKAELQKELERRNAEFVKNSSLGMTAQRVITDKGFISYIIEQIKLKDRAISDLDIKIARQLNVVIEATKDVTTLEKLEEKQLAEYKFKSQKADEAFIEEYVNNREHYK